MDKNQILEKVGWITQRKSIPPLTEEYKERQYCFFGNYIRFLQDNLFTTRELLKPDEIVNDDFELKIGDLTEEGLQFYLYGIIKWREKYDRAKDKEKAINDFAYIEKKLREFRNKNIANKPG